MVGLGRLRRGAAARRYCTGTPAVYDKITGCSTHNAANKLKPSQIAVTRSFKLRLRQLRRLLWQPWGLARKCVYSETGTTNHEKNANRPQPCSGSSPNEIERKDTQERTRKDQTSRNGTLPSLTSLQAKCTWKQLRQFEVPTIFFGQETVA